MTQEGDGDTPNKLFTGYDSIASGMLAASAVTGKHGTEGGRNVVNIRVCESVTILGFACRAGAALDQIKIINGSLKKARFVKG